MIDTKVDKLNKLYRAAVQSDGYMTSIHRSYPIPDITASQSLNGTIVTNDNEGSTFRHPYCRPEMPNFKRSKNEDYKLVNPISASALLTFKLTVKLFALRALVK